MEEIKGYSTVKLLKWKKLFLWCGFYMSVLQCVWYEVLLIMSLRTSWVRTMNLDYVLRHVSRSSYHSKVDGSEQPQTPQFYPAIKYLPVQFVDELRCAGVVIVLGMLWTLLAAFLWTASSLVTWVWVRLPSHTVNEYSRMGLTSVV